MVQVNMLCRNNLKQNNNVTDNNMMKESTMTMVSDESGNMLRNAIVSAGVEPGDRAVLWPIMFRYIPNNFKLLLK